MRLSFWAKADQLVYVPGYTPNPGQAPDYVGRTHILVDGVNFKGEAVKVGQFPAVEEPFRCEDTSPEGQRLLFLTRRDDCLVPADEQTARALGRAFVPHELLDGVMVPVQSASS